MARKNEVARFGKTADGTKGGIITRTLVVYEMKTGYKAEVWNSSKKGWMSKPNEPLMSAKFYEKDGDKDLHRVCEYFGFHMDDQLK